MSEEDVASIQAICAVSKQRAAELLDAASGVPSRAVEIHLQQQQPVGNPSSASVVAIDDGESDQETSENPEENPKKKQRTSSGSKKPNATSSSKEQTTKVKKSSKQGTLHAFLGIEKKESPAKKSQPTIDSFFTSKTAKKGNVTPNQPSTEVASNKSSPSKKATSTNSMDHKEESSEASVGHVSIDAAETKTLMDIKPTAPVSPKKSIAPKPQKEQVQAEPVDPRLSYETLASAFSEIVSTTKRNAKLNMLKDILKGVILAVGGIHGDPTSRKQDARTLTFAIELISGKISQEGSQVVTPLPLQVSGAAVSGALKLIAGGVSKSRFREAYRKTGDLGDVAAEFFSPKVSKANFFVPRSQAAGDLGKETATTSSKSASIVQVHSLLQSVASVPKGVGSQKERHNILVKLLRLTTTKDEMRFLVRILIGNMRLGATMKSILAALAMAVQEVQMQETSTQDPAIQTVQKTFDICPRINRIALSLLCGGVERMVKECGLEVGIPIQPSLANPAHSLEEIKKFMAKGETTCSSSVLGEYKYDGVRCQAHYDGSTMKLFSRHLIDNSQQYPDASRYMLDARKDDTVETFIIDAEIVAVKKDTKDSEWRLLPFQILSTRRGTKNNSSTVQIRVFAFDLMYVNGESLIKMSLWERQRLLAENFKETDGFAFATSQEFTVFDSTKITSFLQEAVKGGAEGLMMKLTGRAGPNPSAGPADTIARPLSTPYESGNRSTTWLKLKRDYVSGFADTLDVVPIGAWYGNGRKAEKGFLSPILFAVYDEDDGVFRSISRCMSFTDDMYTAIREFYFRGTPYPADVGLSAEGDTGKKQLSAEEEADGNDSGSEGDGGGGGEDQGAEEIGAESEDSEDKTDDEVKSCGINCFPSRPSTSVYVTNESPTIWFKPLEVWEVSFADLTLSRTHTAAQGLVDDPEYRGVALRFPRFKRRRPDKGVEQATTSVQIAEFFSKQSKQG